MAEKIYCTDDRKKDMSKTLNLCQMICRITGYLKVHCISDYTENKTWTKKPTEIHILQRDLTTKNATILISVDSIWLR